MGGSELITARFVRSFMNPLFGVGLVISAEESMARTASNFGCDPLFVVVIILLYDVRVGRRVPARH